MLCYRVAKISISRSSGVCTRGIVPILLPYNELRIYMELIDDAAEDGRNISDGAKLNGQGNGCFAGVVTAMPGQCERHFIVQRQYQAFETVEIVFAVDDIEPKPRGEPAERRSHDRSGDKQDLVKDIE